MGQNEIRLNLKIVIISVLALAIATMNVSYSAFFSVKSKSTIQQINAGTLNVTVDNGALIETDLFPTPSSDLPSSTSSQVDGVYTSVTLENEGTLDADYSIAIEYDSPLPAGKTVSDLMSADYLIVGIKENDLLWHNFGTVQEPQYYTHIDLTGESNSYTLLRDILEAPNDLEEVESPGENSSIRQYKIYLWLSEDTPTTEIGKLIYFKINVKSKTIDNVED